MSENKKETKNQDMIEKEMKEKMYVIALDLKGKKFDSEGFAKHLSMCMNQGKKPNEWIFVVTLTI